MLGLFKSKVFCDEQLGNLSLSLGHWKGALNLPHCGDFRLLLYGDRQEPNTVAVELARELPRRFSSLEPSIAEGLFEHYLPYQEAFAVGAYPGPAPPHIENAEQVWPHVKPSHVLIESFDAGVTVEIAFEVAWDIEHTIGARFRDWKFIELNGSV